MPNYDIELTNDYISQCDYQHRTGMYPTFEMIDRWAEIHNRPSIIPTTDNSDIINALTEYLPYDIIVKWYKITFGYQNVLVPLSRKYPDLGSIYDMLVMRWNVHDVVNALKFMRMLYIVADTNHIDPIYNHYIKYSNTNDTTKSETRETDNTDTITKNTTDKKTGTDTTANTGTVKTDGTDNTTTAETVLHGGTDSEQMTANTATTNGVTTYDQTANFVNSTNSVTPSDRNTTTTHGETITTNGTDNTTTSETRTDNTNKQTTYNTTNTLTGTDTHVIDGTVTVSGTGTGAGAGEKWETNLSINEMLERENKLAAVVNRYLASVVNELALHTMIDIW